MVLRHKQFLQIQKQLKAVKNATNKRKLAVKRKKLLLALKELMEKWDAMVVDTAMDISGNEALQKGQELHEFWVKQLQLDLDDEETDTVDNIQDDYEDQVADLQAQLNASISAVEPPEEIDQYIAMLAEVIAEWQDANPEAIELQNAKQILEEAQQGWADMKPLYAEWQQELERVDQDMDDQAALEALQASHQKIQNHL